MRTVIICIIVAILFFGLGWLGKTYLTPDSIIEESVTSVLPIPRPLEKYAIGKLAETQIPKGTIEIAEVIEEEETFSSHLFTFEFDPTLSGKEMKKITGMVNIPNSSSGEKLPLVIMLRGYVDQTIYQTGMGSKSASYFLAENGYLTLAPDFLGYAGSDSEAGNIFESRFQTYTTVLSLLASIESLSQWDGKNIFIWSHSNGSQIALTVLEVTGKEIPTVLWAPVSKPFPYSILYYTDESEDGGKLIRTELAKFESLYNVDQYSITNYFENIKAPIQIHQGTGDLAVPSRWSGELFKKLEGQEVDVSYFTYPGADHNLRPGWDLAVSRSLNFYNELLID